MILDEAESSPPSGPNPPGNNYATWTHASLAAFWDFLLILQRAKTLGPLSISFHAAPPRSLPASEPDPATLPLGTNLSAYQSSTVPLLHTNLAEVDHIKVYHDTKYAMYLRNILDAWGYQQPAGGNSSGDLPGNSAVASAKPKKVRMLKGAKLVLVDEVSSGVLIS